MTEKDRPFSKTACSIWGLLGTAALILIDQLTKLQAYRYLKGNSPLELIPGVLELRYWENEGIAFGLFQGKIPVFLLLCGCFLLAALYCYVKIPKNTYYLPLILILYLMISGAVGNFIDRAFRGTVIDFIYFSLIDFPIFNVADIYVVSSGILLILFVCLKYKDEDFEFIKPGYKG